MPPKKRTSDGAASAAKIQRFRDEQPKTGVPPPPLPPALTEESTRGYRNEWFEFASNMVDMFSHDTLDKIDDIDVRAFIEWERSKLPAGESDNERLRDVANLIWPDNDYEGPGGGDSAHDEYDDHCAGCNRMKESWRKFPKHYRIEPRWRLIGTRHFFCRFCHDNIKAGRRVEIAHPFAL